MKKYLFIPARYYTALVIRSTLIILFFSLIINNKAIPQLVPDFKIAGSSGESLYRASVDTDSAGNIVVVWYNGYDPNRGVYYRLFDRNGFPVSSSVHISSGWYGTLAVKKDGSFVLVYTDNGYILRLYDKFGNPTSLPVRLEDSVYLYSSQVPLSVGIDNNNEIHIALCYTPPNNPPGIINNMYYQKCDSQGNRIGNNILVTNYSSSIYEHREQPVITVREDKSFIIAWESYNGSEASIYMQMYDSNGNKIDSNQKVNDGAPVHVTGLPDISSDSAGNFVIVWNDQRLTGDEYTVFCQLYYPDGTKNGVNFRVDEGIPFWHRWSPKVKMRKDGYWVVGWTDINGPNPTTARFIRFDNNNQKIGSQKNISNQMLDSTKVFSDITLIDDRVISIWQDFRMGYRELYCNVLSFTNPDSTVGINVISEEIPDGYKLYQNYPNPFNPVTVIRFDIPDLSNVKINVYDIQGRHIESLVNDRLPAGKYSVEWNAENKASGIYFYTIEARNQKQTKKMLLIK